MKPALTSLLVLVLASGLLVGCGNAAGSSGGPTPDLCSPAYIKLAAQQVNNLTQQFDDESILAENVPDTQLAPHIATLQAVRRAAVNQNVPACLAHLKALQVTQMDTMIATLLAMMAHDQQSALQGYSIARQQHDQYILELARILDVTPTIITPAATEPSTPTPATSATPTVAADQGTPAPPPALVALNPGPYPVNLFDRPAQGSRLVFTLDVGKAAPAIAQTNDGQWVQVQIPGRPGQKAWAMAGQVVLVPPTPVPTP